MTTKTRLYLRNRYTAGVQGHDSHLFTVTGHPLPGNPNLREALRFAREIGCTVIAKPGSDDFTVSHPIQDRQIVLKSTRKDCPRALLVLLRKACKANGR